MSTITLWILLMSGASRGVSVVDRFVSKSDCEAVAFQVRKTEEQPSWQPDWRNVGAKCVEAKVARTRKELE